MGEESKENYDLMKKYSKLKQQVLSPSMLLNRYMVALLLFMTWMFFFDKYKVSNGIHLSNTIEKLEGKKVAYDAKIAEALVKKEQLDQHSEKYAREKYYMHKENEEVFIIEK